MNFYKGEIYYFVKYNQYWLCISDYKEGDTNVLGRYSNEMGLESEHFKNSPKFVHNDIIIIHEYIYNPRYDELVKMIELKEVIPVTILSEEEFEKFIKADREFYNKRASETL